MLAVSLQALTNEQTSENVTVTNKILKKRSDMTNETSADNEISVLGGGRRLQEVTL
jgi:hypothetical protein